MDDLTECYRILDLEPGASFEEVKHSYRELVRVWHPDRFRSDPKLQAKAEEKLKRINLAYERLCADAASTTASKPPFPYPPRPQQSRPARSPTHAHTENDTQTRSYSGQSPDAVIVEPRAGQLSRLIRQPWIIVGLTASLLVGLIAAFWPAKPARKHGAQLPDSIVVKSIVTTDEKLAELLKAASSGSSHAQFTVGEWYSDYDNDSHDAAKAADWYRMAAEQGHPKAQYKLAGLYGAGIGVKKDKAKAREWYQKAAASGDAQAQYQLGLLYLSSGGAFPQDFAEGAKWVRRAAEQDYVDAQYHLGLIYSLGKGVPIDKAESRRWFTEAAKRGNVEAQVELGQIYYEGIEVPEDYAKALMWLQKAAVQGSDQAQVYLGMAYEFGNGVPKDYTKAAEWYQKAANQGHGFGEAKLRSLRAAMAVSTKADAQPSFSSSSIDPPTSRTQKTDEKLLRHLATDDRLTSGYLLVDQLRQYSGKGKLTLDNGLTEDAYVKLVQNGKLVAAFYVRSHEKFTYSTIPDGIYTVAYCTGYGWDGTVRNFARGRNAHRYDNPLNYSTRRANDGSAITTYTDVMTLTLHKVAFGNAKASDISLEDFDRY